MKKNITTEEKQFQSHLEIEKIKISRTMCILGALLYIVFGIVDSFALSATVTEIFIIRGGVIAAISLCYIATYQSFFIKYYNIILSTAYLAPALGIEAMIYTASKQDHASNVYFAGLILVIMVIFAWSYFKLAVSLVVTSIIVGAYIYIEMLRNIDLTETLINVFFLVSAACIGFVSQMVRDGFVRQNFLLQQKLKESLQEKTEEASDNEYLANHDSLTDLPNRRYMMELLNQSLNIASDKDKVLVIMFIDLNGFKQINDVYGHSAGDEVLLIVAKRLELAIRKGDYLSRLGGDEYLMGLMMEKENLGEIELMANKFVDVISQSMNIEGLRVKVGASIGVAAYPIHGTNIEALINIADHRMYQAKKGKNKDSYSIESLSESEHESVVMFPGKR